MIEILSLPRRPKEVVTKNVQSTAASGLPINSLPGWEQIPLNSKLPMLKCPGNQVIFSKNKIGKCMHDNRRLNKQFDPSVRDKYPEYNALHDSNLRTFYTNQRNLKRLRANGEITERNDVICKLKDFNEYRQQLHRSRLQFILQAMDQMEEEQHDRMLISNAENIASREQSKQSYRDQGYNQVLLRKAVLDEKKLNKFKKSWDIKILKFADIKANRAQILAAIEQNRLVRQLEMQRHWDQRNDVHRKKFISLKKQFHVKNDRMLKNLQRMQEGQVAREKAKQRASWNTRLAERIANQDKINSLLHTADLRKREFIQDHIATHKQKWRKIELEIKKRSYRNRKRLQTWKRQHVDLSLNSASPVIKGRRTFCSEFQGSFDNLLDEDVCKALNTALDLEENVKITFDAGDPIYKAAQFIMHHILKEFRKDLTCDRQAYSSVFKRIEKFLKEVKAFVIFRATQIISAARDSIKEVHGEPNGIYRPALRFGSMGRVSFSKMSSTIGISSYEIHPLIQVRDVGDRRPTPAGSLDSIVVDSTTSLAQKIPATNLCRNELVFIEHYVTKFKRELVVGVGRRVFAAIECHFANKVMDVRQELMDIDRNFLVTQVTKSILGYAVNPLNFESILRLCISALSSDITWSLQQVLLKPLRDPRRIAKPQVRSNCMRTAKGLCLFCE